MDPAGRLIFFSSFPFVLLLFASVVVLHILILFQIFGSRAEQREWRGLLRAQHLILRREKREENREIDEACAFPAAAADC
jgi:hypothetical protein